jgi:hypothetical protein
VNSLLAGAIIGAGTVVAQAGTVTGGWALDHPATVTRTVTNTVTRTVPKTVTVSTGAPSISCQDIGESPGPGVITPGLPGDTMCTITLDSPMGASHLAQITLTAPNGDASTWNLANPDG